MAREKKDKLIVIHCDTSQNDHEDVLEYFGVKQKDCPTFVIFQLDNGSKFRPTDTKDISLRNMRGFVRDYLNGKIEKFSKSAPLPHDWDAGLVKTIVASNFDIVARDIEKNVFVFYYAPWSGKDVAFVSAAS